MTKEQLKAALDRVLAWPPERQDDVVELLRLIEEHDTSPLQLTDEQVAEVGRRMADEREPSLTLDELDFRLRRLGI
jgi:hypothetical protein